ncbi:MAG: DUF2124 domain-containing protein [Methanomicrobiales archaeon]|nr:DUF2124 domain-containing protein [Methanomicrobiales archaeon]
MPEHESFSGIPGILRPFRSYIERAALMKGDQVVYYGVPGTCTPFVELLAFAIRALPVEQLFVPGIDEAKARRLISVPDIGMQIEKEVTDLLPRIIVLMGGLSMPNSGVTAAQTYATTSPHNARMVGVCFMQMFEKTGWLKTFNFDLLIDATVSPVEVRRA